MARAATSPTTTTSRTASTARTLPAPAPRPLAPGSGGRGPHASRRPHHPQRFRLELDEDALARALLGRLDDRLLVAGGNDGQRPRAAGVVEDEPVLLHVGDAVLEDREHGGNVVGADAVTGAQVLVDPDS